MPTGNSFVFLLMPVAAVALVVKSDAPWKTWEEFFDYSKKHPNEVKIVFSSAASTGTIGLKWISKKLGINMEGSNLPR